MEYTNEKGEMVVEIDIDKYERLAVLGMGLGHDDPDEFMHDVILYQLNKMQKEKEED